MNRGRTRAVASTASVFACAAVAGSCSGPLSVLHPAGSSAASLARLGWFVIALMFVITAVMGALLLVAALRRRGQLTEHARYDVGGGTGWVLIGGALVPVVVLAGLYVLTLTALRTIPAETTDAEVHIDVAARQWWWDITYRDSLGGIHFRTANELHIPVGRTVRVTLRSLDVNHSFWVPRLHGKVDAIPGRTNTIILNATEPGVYAGECAEYCGAQHALMRLLVIAQPPEAYAAWAAAQARPAREPTADLAREGYGAFMSGPCSLCHEIAGTPARGRTGPDLTHFGSRRTIAAASLENDAPNLRAWIVNAQSLKPGALMPALPMFDGRTQHALVSYLQSLR